MKSLLFALYATAPLAVMAARPHVTSDDEAVRATVRHYFDGMMQANPGHLRTAFHADARLIGPDRDGGVLIIPFERWASGWEGRDARDPATHRNGIVSVDISGSAAVAKTELVWPDVRYVDYLSLLKVGDDWKIVNKIWTEERR